VLPVLVQAHHHSAKKHLSVLVVVLVELNLPVEPVENLEELQDRSPLAALKVHRVVQQVCVYFFSIN
jgi:hypothetical protein